MYLLVQCSSAIVADSISQKASNIVIVIIVSQVYFKVLCESGVDTVTQAVIETVYFR